MKTARSIRVMGWGVAAMFLAGWQGLSAWGMDSTLEQGPTRGSGVVVTPTNDGAVVVGFEAGSLPEPRACMVQAVSAPGGFLPTDYVAGRIVRISFVMASDSADPGWARVMLVNTVAGRVWSKAVEVLAVAGVAVSYGLTVDGKEPWQLEDGESDDVGADWAGDLASVGAIGIRVVPPAVIAKEYTIGSFLLTDAEGATYRASLTRLQLALKERFGVLSVDQLTAAQKLVDDDGDGMTTVDELRCENDLGYADSIFNAELVATGAEGVTIRWPCVKGEKYGIQRAESLLGGFQWLVSWKADSRLVAAATGYMTYTDGTATGAGPYFYRMIRDAAK